MRLFRALWLPGSLSTLSGLLAWQGFLLYVTIPVAILFLCDLRGRYKDFRYLISLSTERRLRLIPLYGKTACGRQVVLASFGGEFYRPYVRGYYNQLGYRWYHLLPDGFLSRKSPAFQLKFWSNLVSGQRR